MSLKIRDLIVAGALSLLAACNCNDDGDASLGTDADGDGYIAADDGGDDCDDTDPQTYPGAPEECDGEDDDCDELVDENVAGVEGALCDSDGDGWPDSEDCDDDDADIGPGADEICNGVDDDCDGETDEGWDTDGDGAADCIDADGDGWAGDQGDCDDNDAAIHPDAPELCNGEDDDCDGEVDEGWDDNGDGTPDCLDGDGDGYSADEGDCDDDDPEQHPGATEFCNGIDDDCDGSVDEETDVDGDGTPDCVDSCPVYVDLSAPAAAQDGTWTHPWRSVQDGMDDGISKDCMDIQVMPGTYEEQIDFLGADLHVVAVGGRLATVLDALGLGTVVTAVSGEVDARIEGFTIRGGSATHGGGIDVVDSALHVLDNEIIGNVAVQCVGDGCAFGGGIRLLRSDSVIEGNTLAENDAGWGLAEDGSDGGGIAAVFGQPEIFDNTIVDNTAGDGGGLWFAKSAALVYNNIIAGNEALDLGSDSSYDAGQGGGINIQSGHADMDVSNNLVYDNEASEIGGGICAYEFNASFGNGELNHNTVVFNRTGVGGIGAGVALWVNVAPVVRNNIVALNAGDGFYVHATALSNSHGTTATFPYNLVSANTVNWAGALSAAPATTLLAAPLFVGATDDQVWSNDDLHLGAGSPGVDGGDPAAAWNDTDGSRADVGAYGGPEGGW